jgi:phage tail protein X
MRMTTIKTSESSASALVQRLYPTLTESQRRQAESALLKANPHLADSAAFKPGTVVTLPDSSKFKPNANTASDDPVATTLDFLNDALKAHGNSSAKRIDAALEDLVVQEETLKNKEVAAAIKNAPAAAELAKELTARLKTARKTLDEEKKAQEELFGRIAKDIDALFK